VIFLISFFVFALHNQTGLSIKIWNLTCFCLTGNSGLKSIYANVVGKTFLSVTEMHWQKAFGRKKRVHKKMEAGDAKAQEHCKLKNSQKL